MATRKLVRVQEKGQVTVPADLRRRLGIKKGDLVAVEESDGGILITPQEVIAARALDEIGDVLRGYGLTLEDLIEAGREERTALTKDQATSRSEQ